MGLKARLEALNRDAPVVRFLNLISRTCRIPPHPRIRDMPTMRILASATAVTLVLAAGLIATMPPLPLGGLTVIDRNSVLPPRAPPSWPAHPSGKPWGGEFYLVGDEKLVIRDCTIYTELGYGPPDMQVSYYGYASGIHVWDFANLTMINVTVVPSIGIQVSGNASLKMVNVTNWSTNWVSHLQDNPPQLGVYSMGYGGGVIAYDSSSVWIENSRMGGVSRDFFATGAKITVMDSWFARSRKYTAVKVNATISKTEYKWGEPISMTLSLENVGEETINFFSNGTDRFDIVAREYGKDPEGNLTFYRYSPTLPEFRFPSKLEPREAVVQTLTLLNDGSTPFLILRKEGTIVIKTNTWWNSSLNPGKYWLQSSIYSKQLELAVECGTYLVTISEERWQG